MAANQATPMSRVRDMYEGVDPGAMSGRDKKVHIERALQNNLEVLFRIYRQDRLHMVMFRTTRPAEWMNEIQNMITTNQSFQLTKKRAINSVFTITLSGSQEELEHFCTAFDQLHDKVMISLQDGGAAAQRNPQDDEVEQLRARIRELELENSNLQRR